MGQHLYLSGKELISLRLAGDIKNFFNKKHLVSFSMPSKDVPSASHQDTNSDCFNSYVSKTEIRETPPEEIAPDTKDGTVKQCQPSK
jgi:hypothetical protein